MRAENQILATVYDNHVKVSACYFQALPRIGETITIEGALTHSYIVNDIEHKTNPYATSEVNSYNLNSPRVSEVHLLCSKIS